MKRKIVILCVMVAVSIVWIGSEGYAELIQFTNPWGQMASELVVSPVTGELFTWGFDNGDYHKITLRLSVDQDIWALSFDAQVVAVDEALTILDTLQFQGNSLPSMNDVVVVEDYGYIGIDGDIPGYTSSSSPLFVLKVENGNLFVHVRADDPATIYAKHAACSAPEGFDPSNPVYFSFGFIEGIVLVPSMTDDYWYCQSNFPFDTDGNSITKYQITDGPSLIRDGVIIATTRRDNNLGLFDCTDDHIDHYFLKFNLKESGLQKTIGAILYRFGPDLGSFNRVLWVGRLDENHSVVGDDVVEVNPYNPIHHQASTELITSLNDAKNSLVDEDGDGFVELPVYLIDYDYAAGVGQSSHGGIQISNMNLVTTSGREQLLVISRSSPCVSGAGKIVRYEGETGAFIGEFIPNCYTIEPPAGCTDHCDSGGLAEDPTDLIYGPDGMLYIADVPIGVQFGVKSSGIAVKRYNGRTGEFQEYDDEHAAFVHYGDGGLEQIWGLTFGPDGNLYVSNEIFGAQPDNVLRYNGMTGEFIDKFVADGSGGLDNIGRLLFGPDDNLYVINHKGSILRFKGPFKDNPGEFMGMFVPPGSGGLAYPVEDMVFGPDGNLYVSNYSSGNILCFNGPLTGTPGQFIDEFISAGSGGLSYPTGLTFGPDGNLFVGSYLTNHVLRYDGQTGASLGTFANVPSPRNLIFSSLPEPALNLGDFNGDECVDRQDMKILLDCVRGLSPCSQSFELNGDDTINMADARKLVLLFTNPGGIPCQ